ncbi:uncharacterized protein [Palaemon carinicauda]|uniref:uncharacterized protein n=1 Tax=Palaemon carinicauda TaxID=392227 RepID=UPI0035B5BE99
MEDQAPVSGFSGGPRDVALARGERVSVEHPMGNNNVPFSSPDSWLDVSGVSAVEGAVGREDSPQEDPLAWGVPRTPLRSPLDMEEGLSESFPFMAHPSSLVPPTSAVPESFLQPSTSEVRRSPKKPPTGSKDRRESSCAPPSKSRRPSSRQGTWVFVPDNKLRDLTKTSSLIAKRAGDSPLRRASNSLAMVSADERRTSSCRHQFRPRYTQFAQRRESSPGTSSLDGSPHQDERRVRAPLSNNFTKEPVKVSPDDLRTTSCRHKSRPRDIQSDQRRESSPRTGSLDGSPHRDERQVRAPPSNNFTKEPVPSSRAFKWTESSVDKDKNDRGSRPSGGARDHSSRQRRTEEADDEAELPTEYSAYTLIRSYNSFVEPIPQEEEDWTSVLNKFLGSTCTKEVLFSPSGGQ